MTRDEAKEKIINDFCKCRVEYGWEGSDFCIVNAWMPLPAIWEEGESNG